MAAIGRDGAARVDQLLVDELIVDDGGGEAELAVLRLRGVLGSHDAPLADNVAVLLARDFFRHLEDHFDQGVQGKLLRSYEKDAALADIFDDAFKPRAGAVDAVTQGNVELEAARTGYPGWPFLPRMAAAKAGLGLVLHALDTAHRSPVVLVLRGAQEADLVVVAVSATARPGKLVGAAPKHKNFHKFLGHGWLLPGQSSRRRNAIIARSGEFG